MSKRGVVQMTCRKCGSIGHNRRSCKGPVGGNTPLPSNGASTLKAQTTLSDGCLRVKIFTQGARTLKAQSTLSDGCLKAKILN
ncbi:hypothetical protein V6N13_001343 [Hibiscus sabdariffa]